MEAKQTGWSDTSYGTRPHVWRVSQMFRVELDGKTVKFQIHHIVIDRDIAVFIFFGHQDMRVVDMLGFKNTPEGWPDGVEAMRMELTLEHDELIGSCSNPYKQVTSRHSCKFKRQDGTTLILWSKNQIPEPIVRHITDPYGWKLPKILKLEIFFDGEERQPSGGNAS